MQRNLIGILVIWIISIVVKGASADGEHFERSVFRALKKRNGQFIAQMNATATIHPTYQKRPHNYEYAEKFEFGSKSGEFEERRILGDADDPPDRPSFRCLYLDGKEVYRYSNETRQCKSFALNQRTFKYELPRWGSNWIFNRSHVYNILGE